MDKEKRRTKLVALMKKHGLKCPAVADILGYQPQTVRVWKSAACDRTIPAYALKVLEKELLERKRHD